MQGGGYLPPTYLWDSYFGVATPSTNNESPTVNDRSIYSGSQAKKTEIEKFADRMEFASLKKLAKTNPNIVTMVAESAQHKYPALYREIISRPDLFAAIWK